MLKPRYEVRFNNGFWKLFDTVTYSDVPPAERKDGLRVYSLKTEVDEAAVRFNSKKK